MPHQKRVTAAELEAAGPPSLLVGQLRSTNVNMEKKEWVASMLAALTTQDPSSAAAVVQAGAIGPLLSLLSAGSPSGQLHACSALAAIAANNSGHQQQIGSAGGIPPLVSLLRMGSAGIQEQAIKLLASVSEESSLQEPILKTGVLKVVVNMLKGPRIKFCRQR
jgi:hypothetical protein